ncbi:trans-aconitate 2-methyltransferase [Rhodococcoides trifolii]|uniref:Trans-aconitate 2-methyltransferase n=1 Tax=Rhodococcoides trifolii TaxID=908250 RepID=A0A917CLR7_9NOCA|nr:trans-aconitate 2-methyltransferase [Rhodococcus trifolii]GGF92002.1 trans-aconitate 2-methyltransferase [Rhodococcus trifolii]
MRWDPNKYLDFSDHRGRPFYELLSRVRAESPRRVVDLGCGPGNLTVALKERWPDAVVEASDSSPDMVAAAQKLGLDATVLDIREWTPAPDTDVVVSNATLQWVPEHRDLLRRWPNQLGAGAWIAVQVPGNFDAPSHAIIRDLAESKAWSKSLRDVTLRADGTVDSPERYADMLGEAGTVVDAWETTYVQVLTGDDPVLEWTTGTALRPVKASLSDQDWLTFRSELAPLLADAYPRRSDGTTFFPFRRIFVVAQVR